MFRLCLSLAAAAAALGRNLLALLQHSAFTGHIGKTIELEQARFAH